MNHSIPINLVVEDSLSEAILRKILGSSGRGYAIGTAYNRGGSGYIKGIIAGLNNAAKGTPFVVLTDLDRIECAPVLVDEWLPHTPHHNLLFRVAVREVEAWVLADAEAFAIFFGVRRQLLPNNPDSVDDPKQFLVNLVRRCRRRTIRSDVVPPEGSTRLVGPNYNGRLIDFVLSTWRPEAALTRSPSLARTWKRIVEFQPLWELLE
jgi:hypothetical protein